MAFKDTNTCFHTLICKDTTQARDAMHCFVEGREGGDKEPCHNTARVGGSDHTSTAAGWFLQPLGEETWKEERREDENAQGMDSTFH